MFVGGYMTLMAYAAIYLIWGSTYLAIRIAVGAIPPRLPRSATLGAGMPLLLGGLMLLAVSIATRESARYDVRTISQASLWALGYLIVFGSVVAFSAYEWLLRVAPASRVATHAYVN